MTKLQQDCINCPKSSCSIYCDCECHLKKPMTKSNDLTEDLVSLIKDEVNVKEVVWQTDLVEPVKLDLTITPALRAEGQVRDFIRQVQALRKESGLAPNDRVILFVTASPTDQVILESARVEICRVVSANQVHFNLGETTEIRLLRDE